MIVFESHEMRRLVGRVERGEELPAAFEQVAREHAVPAGWIRALGAFEWVELCEYDQAAQRYRPAHRIETPCEILTLEGNLSSRDGRPFVHLHATVSRESNGQIEVLGGHLTAGRVFACEFVLECYDDLELHREQDARTGLALWPRSDGSAGDPEAADATETDAAPSWAQVAAASKHQQERPTPGGRRGRTEKRTRPLRRRSLSDEPAAPVIKPDPLPERERSSGADYLDEPYPERGDWVDHSHFGLCRVDGEDPDGGLIIRLPSGVRKTIRLDFLQVQPPRQEGDKRVFGLRPRRR